MGRAPPTKQQLLCGLVDVAALSFIDLCMSSGINSAHLNKDQVL